MRQQKTDSELNRLVKEIGPEKAKRVLREYRSEISDSTKTLTIIANVGVHHLPKELLRGRVVEASKGNLDFTSLETVHAEYRKILKRLARILQNNDWKSIYLVPFGHSTLSMQIKLLVFRITRIETVDLFYDGRGNYFELGIQQREIIVSSDPK